MAFWVAHCIQLAVLPGNLWCTPRAQRACWKHPRPPYALLEAVRQRGRRQELLIERGSKAGGWGEGRIQGSGSARLQGHSILQTRFGMGCVAGGLILKSVSVSGTGDKHWILLPVYFPIWISQEIQITDSTAAYQLDWGPLWWRCNTSSYDWTATVEVAPLISLPWKKLLSSLILFSAVVTGQLPSVVTNWISRGFLVPGQLHWSSSQKEIKQGVLAFRWTNFQS